MCIRDRLYIYKTVCVIQIAAIHAEKEFDALVELRFVVDVYKRQIVSKPQYRRMKKWLKTSMQAHRPKRIFRKRLPENLLSLIHI